MHYEYIDNLCKKYPTCSAKDLELFPVEQASNTTQKKCSREDSNEAPLGSTSTFRKKGKED